MRFDEIRGRLTGISCPVFGVSWDPPEPERRVARRVVAFLEDRRVLYAPEELEVPQHCFESVFEIRRYLTSELQELEAGRPLAEHLSAMRTACRKFIERMGDRRGEIVAYGGHHGHWASWVFGSALGELRGVFGVHLAQVATEYGLDVERELASVLPLDAASDDGGPEGL